MAALARRVGTPFRSGGQFTASKYPDAQAAYESSSTIIPTVLSGVNFVLHAAGWQEGGLALGFEKLILDADQLGFMDVYARGIDISENGQAMEAFRTNPHGEHFLGNGHTLQNFETAFARRPRPTTTASSSGPTRGPHLGAAGQHDLKRMLAEYTGPASTRRSTPNSGLHRPTQGVDARRQLLGVALTETRASETIGFIGLGNMGLPMCLNLVDAGYDVVALDLRPEPVAEVVAAGGRTADDVAAVAAEADICSPLSPAPTTSMA